MQIYIRMLSNRGVCFGEACGEGRMSCQFYSDSVFLLQAMLRAAAEIPSWLYSAADGKHLFSLSARGSVGSQQF